VKNHVRPPRAAERGVPAPTGGSRRGRLPRRRPPRVQVQPAARPQDGRASISGIIPAREAAQAEAGRHSGEHRQARQAPRLGRLRRGGQRVRQLPRRRGQLLPARLRDGRHGPRVRVPQD